MEFRERVRKAIEESEDMRAEAATAPRPPSWADVTKLAFIPVFTEAREMLTSQGHACDFGRRPFRNLAVQPPVKFNDALDPLGVDFERLAAETQDLSLQTHGDLRLIVRAIGQSMYSRLDFLWSHDRRTSITVRRDLPQRGKAIPPQQLRAIDVSRNVVEDIVADFIESVLTR